MARLRGFLVGVGINMILSPYLALLTLLTVVLYFAFHTPGWLIAAAVLIWLAYGIVITIFMGFTARWNNIPRNQKGISMHPGRTAKFDEMYRKFDPDGDGRI